MNLLVGLGNPEPQYINTKHNVGYDFIDFWKTIKGIKMPVFEIDIGTNKLPIFYCKVQGKEVSFIKPNTGMNDSGTPIKAVMDLCNIQPKDIIVVYDDMDFEIGQYKIKVSGGDGRHNGIKSIINNIGSDFTRLRIGIGKSPTKEQSLEYVLGKFNNRELIDKTIINIVPAVESIIIDGPQKAMNKYNRKNTYAEEKS